MITDYASLQSTIRDMLDDPNLDVQGFISLFENKADRKFRVADMSVQLAQDGTGEEYIDLPADYLELRHINVDGKDLDYVTPEKMDLKVEREQPQVPQYYTIIGKKLRIASAPKAESQPGEGDAEVINLIYYQRIPKLSDSQTTNWLLDAAPDIYLYGSLEHAEAFVYDPQRYAMWKAMLRELMDEYIEADDGARWSGSSLAVKLG